MEFKKFKYVLIGLLIGISILTAYAGRWSPNIIDIGDNLDTTKRIRANNGDVIRPEIRFNAATNKWEKADDGVTFTELGADGAGGGAGALNLLSEEGLNFQLETDTTDWSVTGGALTHTTVGGDVGFGEGSGEWDASAGSQILKIASVTLPNGLLNSNCFIKLSYKYPSGASGDYKLVAKNGAENQTIGSVDFDLSTPWRDQFINFPCNESDDGIITLTAESTTDAGKITFDEAHVGAPLNLVVVNNARPVMQVEIGNSAGICSWSVTSTSFILPTTNNADCVFSNPINSGIGQVVALESGGFNRPGFKWTPKTDQFGLYKACAFTNVGAGSSTNEIAARIFETSTSTQVATTSSRSSGSANIGQISMCGFIDITTVAEKTFQMELSANTAQVVIASSSLGATAPHASITWTLEKVQASSSTIAITPPKTGAVRYLKARHVSAAGTNCLWTLNSTTYVDTTTEDSDCNFVVETNEEMGSDPTSRQCNADDCPGILWTPPKTGLFRVCARPHVGHNNASAVQNVRLQEINTGTTIAENGWRQATGSEPLEIDLCGDLNVTSITEQDLRIQGAENGAASMEMGGVGQGTLGGTAVTWEIWPLEEAINRPILFQNNVEEIILDTPAGHGSSATKVRFYTNVQKNVSEGGCLTLTSNDSTDGAQVTVNCRGSYAVSMSDGGATDSIGTSINADPTVSAASLAPDKISRIATHTTPAFGNTADVLNLVPGDVLRPHDGGLSNSADDSLSWHVVKIPEVNVLTQRVSGAIDSIIGVDGAGNYRGLWIEINAVSGTPLIVEQQGTWVDSITDNGVGLYELNLTSGTCASVPMCTGAASNPGTSDTNITTDRSTSTNSLIDVRGTVASTSAARDPQFVLNCSCLVP